MALWTALNRAGHIRKTTEFEKAGAIPRPINL
jgi:hypothetical protein